MELSDIPPLLDQAQNVINLVNDYCTTLQNADTVLKALADGFINNRDTGSSGSQLGDISGSLDNMINVVPQQGAQFDDLAVGLKQAADELRVEQGNAQAPDVLAQLLMKRDAARALRETLHVLNENFFEHDNLNARIDFEPNSDESAFMSAHRLAHDKLQLLTNNFLYTTDKLLTGICGIWADIEVINDPRFTVQFNTDDFPFALLPVRLETRFMTIKHVRNNRAFEDVAQAFRTDSDAATFTTLNRADAIAPVSMMPSPGILQPASVSEFRPDKHELWVRIYPDDIAMETHEGLLTQDEYDAGTTYWEEVWRAGGVSGDELGAWRVLVASFGPQRAAWVMRLTTPTNPGSKPASPVPHPTPLSPPPTIPALVLKPTSWTEQPHSSVMPDRFVVRVYNNPSSYREVLGLPVPDPLPVGLNPSNPYTGYLDPSGNGLNMPPELRWLTDFEEAEQVGMGIRIPLVGNEAVDGFSRVLVLGLKLSLNASDSQARLEQLFDNHHYKTGLALVPQGTPTNNTEDAKSGFSIYEPGNEGSFAVEAQGPLFTTTTDHYLKADGQRLAEALGISSSVLQHVAHANTFDVKESIAMNRALWSATLGYYLTNLLTPAVLPADVANARDYFTNWVHGRGLIPAFRVGRQPYGVFPATVFSRWTFSDPFSFEGKMHSKIIKPLSTYWENNFISQVKHIDGPDPDPGAKLVDILGLHPASLQFHQRITSGPYLLSNLINFASSAGLGSASLPLFNWPLILNIVNLYNTGIGFNIHSIPRILYMTFMREHRLLNGPVIDPLNLSEIRTVQNIPNGTANYIQWLQVSELWRIRNEDFTNIGAPAGQAPPQALLYLLLRHAWFIEHLEASLCLLKTQGIISIDAGQHYELINLATSETGQAVVTQEHQDLLMGVVRGEVVKEQGVQIDEVMRNLDTNQDYLQSGMTPDQYEAHLWEQASPQIDAVAQDRFGPRLGQLQVEQGLWNYLVQPFQPVSGEQAMEDFIRANLNSGNPCLAQLKEASDALDLLKTLPTARLERLLAEHLDTCAYRLDSWMTSMVAKRIEEQRAAHPQGIYLGAYGILENLKPGPFPGIHVVNVSEEECTLSTWPNAVARMSARIELSTTPIGLSPTRPSSSYITTIGAQYQPATFIYLGNDPNTHLIEDRVTGRIYAPPIVDPEGFILAPSLSHAVTAAILRAGYVAHKVTASGPDTLAVNLTSARVRKAMFYLDGIRNGQSLAALLGYQFERGLHDRFPQPAGPPYSLDQYIYEIRAKYPLVAGSVVSTPTGSSHADAQTSHVTDGLALIQAYRKPSPAWDLGVFSTAPSPTEHAAIVAEIEKIIDAMDAVGDLLLAEAVYQISRGNQERAGAVLKSLGYGSTVPEPEIVNTPRQGNVITNRCGVQLQPAAANATAWTGSSHRALTEPNLNSWLSSQLPSPSDILVNVSYTDMGNVVQQGNVSIDDLGLHPIDLVMIFGTPGSDQQADASELSQRVRFYVEKNLAMRDDQPVVIDYRGRLGMNNAQRNIFEMMPLLLSLVQVVNSSRMMDPADFLTSGDAAVVPLSPPLGTGWNSASLISRLGQAINAMAAPLGLAGVQSSLQSTITAAQSLAYGNPPVPPAGTATTLDNLRNALLTASLFGVDNSVPETAVSIDVTTRDALVAQGIRVKAEIDKRVAALITNSRFSNAAGMPEGKDRVRELAEIAKVVYGRAFKVFADFALYNSTDVFNSLNYTTLLNEAGPYAVEEWMQGVSRVRPHVGNYFKQMMLSETVANPNFYKQRVVQIPVVDMATFNDRWVAMKLPANYEIPGDLVSLVLESDLNTAQVPTCGMVIDDWTEQIPVNKVTTGIAMHYDQPNNEAPQAVLLATTPQIKGYWLWDDLMDTLNETVTMAMKRAVEPDMIQASDLSQVLPALVTPMTGGTATSPSLDLSRNCLIAPAGYNNPINYTAFTAHPSNPNDLTISPNP